MQLYQSVPWTSTLVRITCKSSRKRTSCSQLESKLTTVTRPGKYCDRSVDSDSPTATVTVSSRSKWMIDLDQDDLICFTRLDFLDFLDFLDSEYSSKLLGPRLSPSPTTVPSFYHPLARLVRRRRTLAHTPHAPGSETSTCPPIPSRHSLRSSRLSSTAPYQQQPTPSAQPSRASSWACPSSSCSSAWESDSIVGGSVSEW
jgi:hypothetical protein